MSELPETLYLVRHGQSVGNTLSDQSDNFVTAAPLDHNGDPDWSLTDRGIDESRYTGDWFRAEGCDPQRHHEVWCSPMQRAMQTAHHLGFAAMVSIHTNLAERSSVIPYSEMQTIARESPTDVAINMLMDNDFGGTVEPMAVVIERINAILEAAKQLDSQDDLVIVSHGYIMLAFRYLIENLQPHQVVNIIAGYDTAKRIGNADIVAYSRRDKKDALKTNYARKRHVSPSSSFDSGWRVIPQQ